MATDKRILQWRRSNQSLFSRLFFVAFIAKTKTKTAIWFHLVRSI